MATVEAIEKLLEEKSKAFRNLVKAIETQEKLVEGLVKQEKVLATQAKGSKASKQAKESHKEAGVQLKAAQEKLKNLETSRETAQEKIVELNGRLRGLTEMVKSRMDFLKWWDKEEGKFMDHADKAQELAEDAEEASKKAEQAVSKGDVGEAQKASQAAAKAAEQAKAKLDLAEKLYADCSPVWTIQRNLKTSHLPSEDVKTYAGPTTKVYEAFKSGDKLLGVVRHQASEAARSAKSAAEFADSGGDLNKTYASMLDQAKVTMDKIMKDHKARTTSKVGNYIEKEGEIFTKLLVQYTKTPEAMQDAVEKAIEQSEPLMLAMMNTSRKAAATMEQVYEKSLDRIPSNYRDGLQSKIDDLAEFRDEIKKDLVVYEKKYEVTLVELEKLKSAVG